MNLNYCLAPRKAAAEDFLFTGDESEYALGRACQEFIVSSRAEAGAEAGDMADGLRDERSTKGHRTCRYHSKPLDIHGSFSMSDACIDKV